MGSDSDAQQSAAPRPPEGTLTIDEAVERQFNLRIRHPERVSVYEGFSQRSAQLRGELGERFVAARYGEAERCVIDLCTLPASAPTPLLVFIHGGYWRALDRSIFTFIARPWLARGVQVALIGYELAPQATVRMMVAQCRAAIGWLRAQAGALHLDPARWLLSGHSAGAQLAALSLTADDGWAAAAYLGISGVYDIEPLLRTTVNRELRLTSVEARALSPQHLPLSPATRYHCAVGGRETDGFRGLTHEFVARLVREGLRAQAVEVPGRTHFDVLDELAADDGRLFGSGLQMLRT